MTKLTAWTFTAISPHCCLLAPPVLPVVMSLYQADFSERGSALTWVSEPSFLAPHLFWHENRFPYMWLFLLLFFSCVCVQLEGLPPIPAGNLFTHDRSQVNAGPPHCSELNKSNAFIIWVDNKNQFVQACRYRPWTEEDFVLLVQICFQFFSGGQQTINLGPLWLFWRVRKETMSVFF